MADPEIVPLEKAQASVGRGETNANVETAWAAAEAYTWRRIRPWFETDPEGNPPDPVPPPPGDLVEAVLLLTSRYIARRKSPEGLLGMGEIVTRVPMNDRDYERLIAPWRKGVLA